MVLDWTAKQWGCRCLLAYLWTDVGAGLIKIRLITARRATATEIRYYTES
jgi:hypothetical protein